MSECNRCHKEKSCYVAMADGTFECSDCWVLTQQRYRRMNEVAQERAAKRPQKAAKQHKRGGSEQ